MKRIYFALAVLAMAALAGCQTREFEHSTYNAEKGEIVFRLADSRATRSADVDATVRGIAIPGVTIPMGDDGMGGKLYLEETITRLDDVYYEPETKGTPAYTQNFADLYGTFKAAAYQTTSGSFGSAPFDDGVFNKVADGMWGRKYNDAVTEHLPLYFFLRAPYDLEGTAVKDLTYNTTNGSISFNYDGTSLTSAAAQKDLLFTSRKVVENDLKSKDGIPVLFHHALTGIKFANFFDNPKLDTRTYITKVEITGLADKGKCVITPTTEDGKYVDDTSIYSSASVVVWSDTTHNKTVVVQTFDTTDEIDFATDGNFGNNGSYAGTSFDDAGTANNINKADGSLTFWFIPQQLTSDVKMTVHYKVVNTKFNNKTHEDKDTINLGDLTRKKTTTTQTGTDGEGTTTVTNYGDYATWKAGELRTYTLKAQYVEVELVDSMSTDKFTKHSVFVTNNGNDYEYVRVNLIGNWVGKVQTAENVYTDEETILFGYAAETGDARVDAWNDKDGKTSYGTFVNLVPKSNAIIPFTQDDITNPKWVRYDKYYYYTKPIGPNESITKQVFTSYTVGVSPEFWIPDQWGVRRKAGGVHLIMDVIVQAIPASTDMAGNVTDNYIDAWVEALGKTSADDLLDL